MAVADLLLKTGAAAERAVPVSDAPIVERTSVHSGESRRVPGLARLAVLAASLTLAGLFFLPLWNVRLVAPQYPEGLGMHIRINTVEGATEHDLKNINKLNSYIGMKAIEPDAIPELRIMPWVVGALILMGLLTAFYARRRLVYSWTAVFLLVAVAGLVDFWKWEYDYGHNLDLENAVIRIPGMSYQPPLIGSKQLLNFTATSLPAAGGILAGVAMVLALSAAFLVWRQRVD